MWNKKHESDSISKGLRMLSFGKKEFNIFILGLYPLPDMLF